MKKKSVPKWYRKLLKRKTLSPIDILRKRIAAKSFPSARFKDFLKRMRDHVRPAFEVRCGAFTSRRLEKAGDWLQVDRKRLSGVAPWLPFGEDGPSLQVRFDHSESYESVDKAIKTIFPPGDRAKELLNIIEGAKAKQREHIRDFFHKGKFYDKWFEYFLSIEGEEWRKVFEASPGCPAGVEKKFQEWDGRSYLRIPDAVILKITADLFDKIEGVVIERDDSTLRQYLAKWKRRVTLSK